MPSLSTGAMVEADVLSDGLVALRRLSHCEALPPAARRAAVVLARVVAAVQPHPSLRAIER